MRTTTFTPYLVHMSKKQLEDFRNNLGAIDLRDDTDYCYLDQAETDDIFEDIISDWTEEELIFDYPEESVILADNDIYTFEECNDEYTKIDTELIDYDVVYLRFNNPYYVMMIETERQDIEQFKRFITNNTLYINLKQLGFMDECYLKEAYNSSYRECDFKEYLEKGSFYNYKELCEKYTVNCYKYSNNPELYRLSLLKKGFIR